MIEGRYTDEEWQTIVEATGNDAWIDGAREPLEQAIREYCKVQSVVLSMKDSARRRKQWADVQKKVEALLLSVREVECWDPPSWGGKDGEEHPGQKRAIEAIDKIVEHAQFCTGEYGSYARGRNKPEHAALYSAVLQVWKNYMGRSLGFTQEGPVERFFRAALFPVLGDQTPKGTGVRDIVKAEKSYEVNRLQSDARAGST